MKRSTKSNKKTEPKFSKSNIAHCAGALQAHVCINGPRREESLSMQPTKMPNSQAPVDIIFQKLNPTTALPP